MVILTIVSFHLLNKGTKPEVGKLRLPGHMRPARQFYTARWLSKGIVSKVGPSLESQRLNCAPLEMKNIRPNCQFLQLVKHSDWLCDFAFAVDMFDRLNEISLNVTIARQRYMYV